MCSISHTRLKSAVTVALAGHNGLSRPRRGRRGMTTQPRLIFAATATARDFWLRPQTLLVFAFGCLLLASAAPAQAAKPDKSRLRRSHRQRRRRPQRLRPRQRRSRLPVTQGQQRGGLRRRRRRRPDRPGRRAPHVAALACHILDANNTFKQTSGWSAAATSAKSRWRSYPPYGPNQLSHSIANRRWANSSRPERPAQSSTKRAGPYITSRDLIAERVVGAVIAALSPASGV